jgi:hypothetical protein
VTARDAFFAIAPADQWRLHAAAEEDPDRVWDVIGELEDSVPDAWQFHTDKAWDALDRCFEGAPPLDRAICGGIILVNDDSGLVSVKAAGDLPAIADAIERVSLAWLRQRYWRLDPEEYGETLSDEDFAYTWSNFQGLPAFFRRAALARDRAIVFSVAG